MHHNSNLKLLQSKWRWKEAFMPLWNDQDEKVPAGYHPVASLLLTESDGAAFWPSLHFDEGESEKFNSATLMKKVRVKSLSWMKGGAHHRIKTCSPSTIELTSWQLRPSSSEWTLTRCYVVISVCLLKRDYMMGWLALWQWQPSPSAKC